MRDVLVLSDLVDLDRWHRLQDHLTQVLGVPVRTFNLNRDHVVNPSWPESFPMALAVEKLRIGDEVETLIPRGASIQEPTSLTTALEVTFSVVPLKAGDHVIAYMLAGPMVLGPRSDEQQFCSRMDDMGLDGRVLWSLMLSLKSYSYAANHSVLNMLDCISALVLGYAFEAFQKKDSERGNQPQYLDRMLQSLLQAATLATQADGGSVMVFNKESEALTIRAAEGLSDDIVEHTRVRRGEGIAGLVAAQNRIQLIDNHSDSVFRERMRRSDVVSSLIAPLRLAQRDEVYGVLNLRVTDPDKRFNESHVRLLERLLDLTQSALTG